MVIRISEFIEQSNKAETKEEVFELFLKALETRGYDRMVYSYMTDSPTLNKKAQHGVARNYPEDWMKYYLEKEYMHYDPVYRLALISRKPFIWDEIQQQVNLSPIQKKVMEESRESKLRDGIALSVLGPSGEVIGIGVASSAGGIKPDKNTLSIICALANQFHIAYTEFEEQFPSQLVDLTKREREILLWVARGKSNSVIAEILNISDHSVDFHLRNIFKKLDSNSKTVAVLKAYKLGLISL